MSYDNDDIDDRYLNPAEKSARDKERERLHNLSVPELKALYEKRVKDLLVSKLEQAEEEVLEELKQGLKAIVAASFGLRPDSWGKWEVSTNRDGTAALDRIGRTAMAIVEKEAPEILKQLFTPGAGPYTKLRAAIDSNIVSYCHKYAAEAVKRGVEAQVRAKVDSLLELAGIGTKGENDP